MGFKEFANQVKDAALQQVVKWFVNHHRLNRLGRIASLRLDSATQHAFLVLELNGETEPVELTIHYRVLNPTLVEITEVQASRQWMTEFINHMVPEEQKRMEVPTSVTRALSKLVE